jgi:hypothetical protein
VIFETAKNRIMKKYKGKVLLIFICICSFTAINAQDSLWVRDYQFGIYNNYDLRNSSSNAISVHALASDLFRKGVVSKMGPKLGKVSYGVFNFASTFLTLIWSHEFGHSLRAKQVDGYFKIHNFGVPIPYTTMHLPSDISITDEALSVTGGFEVNSLSVQNIQRKFIARNGLYNEDLAFSFANRLFYPLYTTIIVPINPNEKNVWIETAGDPVHIILPVFKNYSNNQVFMEDSTVNPALVKLYGQAALFATFFNLLDPQFYREVGASFGNMDKLRTPIFLIGDHKTGWTYGTMFNVSPLGYELYLNNYIHLNDRMFVLSLKYGNPFKNNGLTIGWQNIVERENISLSSYIDIWDQDIFGKGMALDMSLDYKITRKVGVHLSLGYKTEGYVLGKKLDAGLNAGLGFIYYGKY